jgi:glycosyltransferase involved in cell wall biosynthesis
MLKLSAVIITFNEENYIDRCLESLKDVADEIVVVDSFSTDWTKEICYKHNVNFIEHEFEGYKEQKNWAMEQASFDYILSLDGDEALSEKLKDSILNVKQNWKYDGYSFKRLNNFYGKWLKHSGVYPDRKLRLFDRRKGKWGGVNPHDIFKLKPGSSHHKIKGDLLHYVQSSVDEHIEKVKHFSTIIAKACFDSGQKSSVLKIIIHPTWRFFYNYVIRLGFLDGFYGLKVCSINALLSYLKHVKIKQLNTEKKNKVHDL